MQKETPKGSMQKYQNFSVEKKIKREKRLEEDIKTLKKNKKSFQYYCECNI